MTYCHIDIESFSEINLKKVGIFRYAEHASTEVLVLCYAFDDGPVHTWVPVEELPRKVVRDTQALMEEDGTLYIQEGVPEDLREYIESGGECRAHNSQFERVMLNGGPGQKIGFPHTDISQWVCTAAKAAAHSLPRALAYAAIACGTYKKDEVGKQDMMAVVKPRTGKIKRYTPENAPERFVRMYSYCMDDVRAERGIDEYIPELSAREQRVFEMDQEINDRGVRVDLESVDNVQRLIAEYKSVLEDRCIEMTGVRPTQTAKLAEWVRENGYEELENLQAPTIKAAMADKKCPAEVRRVLRIRALHSMKAVSKYDAIERSVTEDERLHGMFLYHGAGTGRWSSLIVQLQNLYRPVIEDPDVAIDAFSLHDLGLINWLWEKDPMKVFASCVRGMLTASDGKILVGFDYSAIEARIVAWIAQQLDILKVFATHGKVYEYTAAQIYKMKDTSVAVLAAMKKTHPDRRFVGKVAVLALGYQGGKKAFAKMAKNYGVDIDENDAEDIKKDWRDANDKIVKLWYDLEECAVAAVRNPGKIYKNKTGFIMFRVVGDFLYMRLPSGRRIAYFKPEVDSEGKLTYYGIDTYTRQWGRVNTYGGKLTENAVQGIARDLLVEAMFKLREAGYDIIGTVHDEVILESKDPDLDEIDQLMCELPDWAEGLPVAAEGFKARRYRK